MCAAASAGTVAIFTLLPRDLLSIGIGVLNVFIFAMMTVLGLIPGAPEANRYGEPQELPWAKRRNGPGPSGFD